MFKHKANIKTNVKLDCKTEYKCRCYDNVKTAEHNLEKKGVKNSWVSSVFVFSLIDDKSSDRFINIKST